MEKPIRIKYEKKAIKYLTKIDRPTAKNIRESISGLTEMPPKGDIKPLIGYKDGRQRLRYGKYRIIFRYEETEAAEFIKILLIMNIGSRGDIYKED